MRRGYPSTRWLFRPASRNGELDRHGGFPANNDSRNVDYLEIPADGIVWYTSDGMENNPSAPGYDSSKPLTFALPNPGVYRDNVYNDPIPARYRTNGTTAFVWRHDDEGGALTGEPTTQPSFWPYLLRIRYRVHDSRGRINSCDNQHGIWFEHIVRVNRP